MKDVLVELRLELAELTWTRAELRADARRSQPRGPARRSERVPPAKPEGSSGDEDE
jgi:hypothetical protein